MSNFHKKINLIVGTVPDDDFPLTFGQLKINDYSLKLGDHELEINRGTCALAASTCTVCKSQNMEMPYAVFAGDTGDGLGSRKLYEWLIENLAEYDPSIITFHYIQPQVRFHDMVLPVIDSLSKKPILLADAGYMYAAKMSGQAHKYDLFTPDIGELAYLADPDSPHPFYTRGFILHDDHDVERKIKRAYECNNASEHMIVKGKIDYIVTNGQIIQKITEPDVANLEPIGGTGDTITGIASALIYSGKSIPDSCIMASRINRIAGQLANPTPATQVGEIIEKIPDALSSIQGS